MPQVTRLFAAPPRYLLRRLGYDVVRIRPPWPRDFEAADIELYEAVAPHTMTSPQAILGLAEAVRYVAGNDTGGRSSSAASGGEGACSPSRRR